MSSDTTVLGMMPHTIQFGDRWVMGTIVEHDGKFAGTIGLIRTDDDTSWGERRQAWLWTVMGPDGHNLGHCKSVSEALMSGCDAEPHPVEMFSSLLHYMAAGVEARNNPDSENYGIFNPDVVEWAYQMDSELSSLDLDLTVWLEGREA